jgi:hypothetical protein
VYDFSVFFPENLRRRVAALPFTTTVLGPRYLAPEGSDLSPVGTHGVVAMCPIACLLRLAGDEDTSPNVNAYDTVMGMKDLGLLPDFFVYAATRADAQAPADHEERGLPMKQIEVEIRGRGTWDAKDAWDSAQDFITEFDKGRINDLHDAFGVPR